MIKDRNLDYEKIMKAIDSAYKSFLKKPTQENMQKIIALGEIYRETWIARSSELIPSQDSPIGSKTTDEVDELKDFNEFDENLTNISLAELDTFGSPSSKSLQRLKRRFIKTTINRVDSDLKKNNKGGGSSIITSSIYHPDIDSDFIQHAIVGSREKNGKLFNRRWYLEKHEGSESLPWWTSRKDFSTLIKKANENNMFQESLNDSRIREDKIKVIFSDDLPPEIAQQLFSEITLPQEREELANKNINFVIVETNYLKSFEQILSFSNSSKAEKIAWRDVCIFSPEEITFRSLTTDKAHSPSVAIPDNPIWKLSNDMCNTSNQAMIAFLSFTDRKLKINTDGN